MAAPPLRAYLAGEICVEADGRVVGPGQLPGPLGRHLLAYLIAEHDRTAGHDELAEELWDGATPAAWRTSLKALVCRSRTALGLAGLDGAALLVGGPGVYLFRLPADGWIGLDSARAAAHDAETWLGSCAPATRRRSGVGTSAAKGERHSALLAQTG